MITLDMKEWEDKYIICTIDMVSRLTVGAMIPRLPKFYGDTVIKQQNYLYKKQSFREVHLDSQPQELCSKKHQQHVVDSWKIQ